MPQYTQTQEEKAKQLIFLLLLGEERLMALSDIMVL